MAVQIINDMPDAAIDRGEPARPLREKPALREVPSLRDWARPQVTRTSRPGRPVFIAITIAVHVIVALGFLSVKYAQRTEAPPTTIVASIIDAPAVEEEAPAVQPPPTVEIAYTLPQPEQIQIETDSITAPAPTPVAAAISTPAQSATPPLVESVDYVRLPAPVYPQESRRRREHGTVLLRVLVDVEGKPAQIRVERTSGYERLDVAATEAVRKALFRPHEVNGVRQAAQVLIPIEFTRRAS